MIILVGPRGCISLYLLLMIIVGFILVILRVSRDVSDPANWRWAAARMGVHAPAPAGPKVEPKQNVLEDTRDEGGRAFLVVRVPAAADVWLDGLQGKQTGSSRSFRSPPLDAGTEYEYEVRARWREAGRVVDRTRRVKVHAGARAEVDFTGPDAGKR